VAGRSLLYEAFRRCCARAGTETQTYDTAGRLMEHVDVHSPPPRAGKGAFW
jgi:hypothetical protein